MRNTGERLTYGSYLELDRILNSQTPQSGLSGKPAHDEMFFIIVHQTYELWFKQYLHELNSVIEMFNGNFVDEMNIGISIARLQRVVEIEKLMIEQIKVLETLAPLDFLDFRNFLGTASGFQSVQFREIEHKLGLKHEQREKYNAGDYYADYGAKDQQLVKALQGLPTLFDVIERWLERTPFLDTEGFNFLKSYRASFAKMVQEDRTMIESSPAITESEKQLRLQMIAKTESYFATVLDPESYEVLREQCVLRLSHKACLAALFITLYRDMPILQMPYRLLATLLDVDEYLTLWRYRHALMVLRMVGNKMGTGGSTGNDYLRTTVEKHKVFSDLFNLSTLLISRSQLPTLDAELVKKLGFYYSTL